MRKILALLAMVALSTGAFAHGGKAHRLMGTVDSVQENQLTVTTADNHKATVSLAASTSYEKDGKPVDRSALVAGARVSIQLDESDKTAVKIKIGAAAGGETQEHHR